MNSEWGHSYQQKQNNNYYWYPKDMDEFKKMAYQDGGIELRILGENINIRYSGNVGKLLKAPIPIRLRSMTLKEYENKKIREIFSDCEIYGVPKSKVDVLNNLK